MIEGRVVFFWLRWKIINTVNWPRSIITHSQEEEKGTAKPPPLGYIMCVCVCLFELVKTNIDVGDEKAENGFYDDECGPLMLRNVPYYCLFAHRQSHDLDHGLDNLDDHDDQNLRVFYSLSPFHVHQFESA